jgi:hypothetical protein
MLSRPSLLTRSHQNHPFITTHPVDAGGDVTVQGRQRNPQHAGGASAASGGGGAAAAASAASSSASGRGGASSASDRGGASSAAASGAASAGASHKRGSAAGSGGGGAAAATGASASAPASSAFSIWGDGADTSASGRPQPISVGKDLSNWTGKWPTSLLQEHCQKSKWKSPKYILDTTGRGVTCKVCRTNNADPLFPTPRARP